MKNKNQSYAENDTRHWIDRLIDATAETATARRLALVLVTLIRDRRKIPPREPVLKEGQSSSTLIRWRR